MHSAFITVNQVPTRVTTWGQWIEEDFEGGDLVVFIPGNPGFSKYYAKFLQTVHDQVGWPVWVLGHAGHDIPEDKRLYPVPELKGHEDLYTLDGQVKHSVEFLEKYLPKNARIHLVGHSVGSYIICQLLKIPSIKSKVVKSYLLFPTIEHIGDTPNDKIYSSIFHRIVFLILLLAWFFSILPRPIQYVLVYIYAIVTSMDKTFVGPTCAFVNPQGLEKVFFTASDEMVTMKGRDDDLIKENIKKMKFYFGGNDGWAPIEYCHRLKDAVPGVDAEVDQRGFTHAFCLRSSKEMGLLLADWLKNN